MKLYICVLVLYIAYATAKPSQLAKPVPLKDAMVGSKIMGRITNGFAANEGQVPYIVGLSFSASGRSWWCGGSIIGNTWVLTAAHCTNTAASVTIYYGDTRRMQSKLTHTVDKTNFKQHPNYNNNNLNNDISLIKTPAVEFGSLVNKIALPSSSSNTYANWWVIASGWGKTSDTSAVSSFLNTVEQQIIPNSECVEVYGTSVVTNNLLCTSTPKGNSICSGDSGGPLILQNGGQLVGVASFVAGEGCTAGLPNGFTRVTSYLDWIRQHTGISY